MEFFNFASEQTRTRGVLFVASLLLCLFFLAACPVNAQDQSKSLAPCRNKNGLTVEEIAAIIQTHNVVRAGIKLAPLKWDCGLADLAQEWAKRGITLHRDDNFFGESIFVAEASDVLAVSAVTRWMDEKPNWNNDTGICSPGKKCTHYTQIVWKRTAKIGCGINRSLTGRWKTMLVCNYDPAGNDPGPAY